MFIRILGMVGISNKWRFIFMRVGSNSVNISNTRVYKKLPNNTRGEKIFITSFTSLCFYTVFWPRRVAATKK